MPDNIKYTVLKAVDFSKALAGSETAVAANEKMRSNQGLSWVHTVAAILPAANISGEYPQTKEGIEEFRKTLIPIFETEVANACGGSIPVTGKNRKGEVIEIKNTKTGGYKFASWDKTKVTYGYLGDIAKIVVFGLTDLLLPEANKVAGRSDLLKLCKVQSSAIENIRRLGEDMQGFLDQVTVSTDVQEAHAITSTLTVNNLDVVPEMRGLITRLDALLGVATANEKNEVRQQLVESLQTHLV
jgi:hypothetical protein